MIVSFWGTRGSIAAPGPETVRYGGNTSCVSVTGNDGTVLVLDAGTGIRRLGAHLPRSLRRVDILLSHLHMDHIQGLGFFSHLRRRDIEVHIWGPPSSTQTLRARLARYLSPPLFPVLLRDLPCQLEIHEVPATFDVGAFHIEADLVIHPGPTVGYRVTGPEGALAYIPDHEPMLSRGCSATATWTSGHDLAAGVDLLIHDGQYTPEEYADRVGWGHSTLHHAVALAAQAGVKRLVPFHHEPTRSDDALEAAVAQVLADTNPSFPVTPAAEGQEIRLGGGPEAGRQPDTAPTTGG